MSLRKSYDVARLRDYSSLFLRSEATRWYRGDWSSLKSKIMRYDPGILKKNASYLSYLKQVYQIITENYPNEYVYKNELINKWLLAGKDSATAVTYSEFRLGNAIADIAQFNGVSRAFEVKTLIDNETRLTLQLEQYKRLFNEIYLVVPSEKCDTYKKYDNSTGIVAFEHTNKRFRLERPATRNDTLEVDVLMQVLHTGEYIAIAQKYHGTKLEFDDFNKFNICKQIIQNIPIEILNNEFIQLMKKRRENSFSKKNHQFNQLFLAMNASRNDRKQLIANLSTKI